MVINNEFREFKDLASALPKLPIFSKFTIAYRSMTPLPTKISPLYHAAN